MLVRLQVLDVFHSNGNNQRKLLTVVVTKVMKYELWVLSVTTKVKTLMTVIVAADGVVLTAHQLMGIA